MNGLYFEFIENLLYAKQRDKLFPQGIQFNRD